jgi:hypothetical protein
VKEFEWTMPPIRVEFLTAIVGEERDAVAADAKEMFFHIMTPFPSTVSIVREKATVVRQTYSDLMARDSSKSVANNHRLLEYFKRGTQTGQLLPVYCIPEERMEFFGGALKRDDGNAARRRQHEKRSKR